MKRKEESPTRAHIARKNVIIKSSRVVHPELQPVPKDEEAQNKLARELIRWVYTTESRNIEDFALSKYMNPYKFKHIGDSNEYFRESYDTALHVISSRLQEGVHERKLDRELAIKMLPLYNREYREWFIETRKIPSLTNNIAPQVIYLEAVPNSPLVPERAIDERRVEDPLEQV